MDRRTLLAFIIIGLVLVFYPLYVDLITGGKKKALPPEKEPLKIDTTYAQKDTTFKEEIEDFAEVEGISTFEEDTSFEEKRVTVETDLYQAEFTTRGGDLVWFVLKKYQYTDDGNIQLLPQSLFEALGIEFPEK